MHYVSRLEFRTITCRGLYMIYRTKFNPILAGMLALIGRVMSEKTLVEVFEFRGRPVESYIPKTKIVYRDPPRKP